MKKSGFGLRKMYSQKNKLDLGMGVFEQEKKSFFCTKQSDERKQCLSTILDHIA